MSKEIEVLQEMAKVSYAPDKEKQALQFALKAIQERDRLREGILTKEEFRSILSEFPPSIAEDSGQPEWTVGELDKLWDFLIGKCKWVYSSDGDRQTIAKYKSALEVIRNRINDGNWAGGVAEIEMKVLYDIATNALEE